MNVTTRMVALSVTAMRDLSYYQTTVTVKVGHVLVTQLNTFNK